MPRILLDHVAIGLDRISDAVPFVGGELGGRSTFGHTTGAFRFWQWRFANEGCLELLEPAGPPNGFLHRFLDRHGAGLHHVTFKVPSLDETCTRARAMGYEIVGYDDSDPSWKEAFLHPKDALGIVIQFAESHPELAGPLDDGPEPDEPPPAPDSPAPSSELLGLRLTAPDEASADRQWRVLLQAEWTRSREGLLIYRWPPAPLRITVEIRGDRDPGPELVEVIPANGTRLPDRAHPVLGARFADPSTLLAK